MVDLDIAYRIMAEPDSLDPESKLFAPPKGAGSGRRGEGKVLGICRPWFDRADKEVREVCWKAIEFLERERGYEVVDISLPLLHEGQLELSHTVSPLPPSLCPAGRCARPT